jgi:hypothetical protein
MQPTQSFKRAGVKMELLSEQSKRNDTNFFRLLDEMHEDWREKYEHL